MIEFPITLTSGGSVCLPGYASALALGYTKNKGVYRLRITATGEWEGLTIQAFWHVPDGKDPASSLVVDGYVAVPASVTAQPGNGCVTFEGSDGTKTVTSADLRYRVAANSGTEDGTEPEPGTPAWQQLVDAVHTDATAAEQAKTDAQTAAQQAEASAGEAAASAKNAGQSAAEALVWADAAKRSALAAGSNSQNAAQYAGEAKSFAEQAADSSSAAESSASAAAGSQQAAESSAKKSDASANTAQESATMATGSASKAAQAQKNAETAAARAETAQQKTEEVRTDALDKISAAKADALKAVDAKQADATAAVERTQKKALDAVTAAQGTAVKAVSDAQSTATQAVQTAQTDAVSAVEKAGSEVLESIPEDYQTTVKKDEELKTEKAEIDDATVGLDAWSSKHIIDTLCPPLEETGNPVVCYPVTGYPLGVTASWEPTQEGSGEPSPDNIRPISGRDAVKVERCGGNVIEFLSTYDSSSGIKVAVDAEKNITLNGTLDGKGNIYIGTCRLHWVAGKNYTMYVKKVGGSASIGSGDGITFAYSLFTTDYNHYFRGDTNSTNIDAYIARDVALVETELIFMLQCWRDGTVFNDFKFQIEVVEGTTAPTTYAPYTGQTATLTLPRTIYGGTVDAVTGEGQETWKLLTLDGTTNKFTQTEIFLNLPNNSAPGVGEWYLNNLYCSHFPNIFGGNATFGFLYTIMESMSKYFPDVDALNSYLVAQYAAGTPVQIAYKLAEPVLFTATGAQPIPALSGVTTVLTDADSATVTGRADPIKRITDLEDAVASMTTT